MRLDYGSDPTLWPAVRRLLVRTFPGFDGNEADARAHGLRWESCSTPFAVVEDGDVVAHVGVLRLPLVIGGRPVVAAGVHAVATAEDRRGCGLAGSLLREALAWAERDHETQMLTASSAALYAGAGFRHVPESRFLAVAPPAGCATHVARPFDWDHPADRARLDRLLATREPVSRRLAVTSDRAVFLFDSARAPLAWVDAWDGALWLAENGGHVRVIDVLARRMPRWADVVKAFPAGTRSAEIAFAPDVLGGEFAVSPGDPGDILMVRGPFPTDGLPLALSPASRC